MRRLLLFHLLLWGTVAQADPEGSYAALQSPKGDESENAAGGETKAPKSSDTAPAEKTPRSSNSDYNRALEFYRAGKLKEAAGILRSINSEEEKGKAALLLGTMYYQKKKPKRAKKYFDQVDDTPLSKETAYAYGATYLQAEEYSKALKGLRANIKLKGPNRTLTLYKIGVAYYKLGQYSRAERYFNRTSAKTLPKGLGAERQRYLSEIRQHHDELLGVFLGDGSEMSSPEASSREIDGNAADDDWSGNAAEQSWGLRWRPNAMLRQESNQNINKGDGRDTTDTVTHRVGLKTYAGGDSSSKSVGSMEVGAGFAGYDVKNEHSQTFDLPNISGSFLSQEKDQHSEDNFFFSFKPTMGFEVSSAMRAEVGASFTGFLPHFKSSDSWGQSEGFVRLRAEGKEIDGGFEFAMQQPFDEAEHVQANDLLLKADLNQRLGDFTLRVNGQGWKTDNTKFVQFDRDRMTLLDSRFRYHLGFKSEARLSVSGSMLFGDILVRASYDYANRASDNPVYRLNAFDDPETVARESNKRSFVVSLPLLDTLSLSLAAGTQNLTGYRFQVVDPDTGVQTKEYKTNSKQTFGQIGVSVALVDWIKIRINYTLAKYTYENPATADDAFQIANPKGNENSVMQVELSKSF